MIYYLQYRYQIKFIDSSMYARTNHNNDRPVPDLPRRHNNVMVRQSEHND